MAVKRIVSNIASSDTEAARCFYGDVLGMTVEMDLGWIVTFGGAGVAQPQISVASAGGSGTAVPDVSIEVDDLVATYERAMAAGAPIEYGPATEPWGG